MAGRPKSEATVIKELKEELLEKNAMLAYQEESNKTIHVQRAEMESAMFDLWILLDELEKSLEESDDLVTRAKVKALRCLADNALNY